MNLDRDDKIGTEYFLSRKFGTVSGKSFVLLKSKRSHR